MVNSSTRFFNTFLIENLLSLLAHKVLKPADLHYGINFTSFFLDLIYHSNLFLNPCLVVEIGLHLMLLLLIISLFSFIFLDSLGSTHDIWYTYIICRRPISFFNTLTNPKQLRVCIITFSDNFPYFNRGTLSEHAPGNVVLP